jgi:hypothetical protein
MLRLFGSPLPSIWRYAIGSGTGDRGPNQSAFPNGRALSAVAGGEG